MLSVHTTTECHTRMTTLMGRVQVSAAAAVALAGLLQLVSVTSHVRHAGGKVVGPFSPSLHLGIYILMPPCMPLLGTRNESPCQ